MADQASITVITHCPPYQPGVIPKFTEPAVISEHCQVWPLDKIKPTKKNDVFIKKMKGKLKRSKRRSLKNNFYLNDMLKDA